MSPTLFIVLAVSGALVLMGLVLSGYGSNDRTPLPPPHLPGHELRRTAPPREDR